MCGLSMGSMAQETTADPVEKYSVATNSFWNKSLSHHYFFKYLCKIT